MCGCVCIFGHALIFAFAFFFFFFLRNKTNGLVLNMFFYFTRVKSVDFFEDFLWHPPNFVALHNLRVTGNCFKFCENYRSLTVLKYPSSLLWTTDTYFED